MNNTNTWRIASTLCIVLFSHSAVQAADLSPSMQLQLAIENRTSDEWLEMAKKQRRKGHFDKAQQYAVEALAKSPESIDALETLALLAKNKQDYETAVGYYDDLLNYHPDYLVAYLGLAESYKLQGDTESEEATLNRYKLLSAE